MKKTYLLILFFAITGVFAQVSDVESSHIAEAEMKSASQLVNFAVNANTQNYDVTYHKLEFTVNPAVYNISGKVTTTFTALSNMSTVTFDFYKKSTSPFTISSVKKDGVNLSFVHNSSHELVITLPATLNSGNSATVEIIYNGAPSTAESAFTIGTHSGASILYTLSEPYGARDWWPCKQDLNDKVNSIDVFITAPSQYVSVSNGIEPTAPVINGANKTTHFHHGYPIPAYLIAMAVTNYSVFNQQGGLGTVGSPFFPIVNYIYPETATSTQTSLAVTPTIINLFETLIGNYPFRNEKYGHAQFGWGGGMEHTTVSFMGGWSRSLIAHEMAHQWFGDKITCGTWKDIWLNEGITEYMSGIVVENLDGASSFVSWKNSKINNITSQTTGNLYLTDTQITDVNTIFSSRITYNKGSMVTNMIRFKMGDTNFFQALRNYLADPALAYGYALTPQFKAHLETVSGLSFTEFFNDWVYNQGYPIYNITAHNSGAGQVTIQINQTQSITNSAQTGYVSYFEMPVPIRLTGGSGEQLDVVLDNTTNGQSFVVPVGFIVTGVEFDPNKNIISKNNTTTLGTENFALAQSIKIYPNPTSDILNIGLPASMNLEKVRIYNNLGQTIIENTSTIVPVSSLSSGVHFVEIVTSDGTFHKKFIKK
ncbi:MAG: M1 family aminopeptidase [Flavobacterium sp.]